MTHQPDTADLALREQIARVVAAELACQDGQDVTPEAAFGTSAELTWGYLDQGEVDFGKIADRVIALPALAQAVLADRAEIERLRAVVSAVNQALSDAGLLLPDGFVAVPREAVAACEGEQRHFETWAMAERYDMDEHPMFYLFMDEKTNAARKGWNAALAYVRAMIQAQEKQG